MMVTILRIVRRKADNRCIYGTLSVSRPFGSRLVENYLCHTLELPWRDNDKGKSCIPPGTYPAFVRTDGPKGWRLELRNTQDRKNIQIHVGNTPNQIEGCILVGLTSSFLSMTSSVTHSLMVAGEMSLNSLITEGGRTLGDLTASTCIAFCNGGSFLS